MFSDDCDSANSFILNERASYLEKSDLPGKQKLVQRNCEHSKLWIEHDKKLVLHGIIVEDEIIRQEPQKTLKLGAEWQKAFNAKDFDVEGAKSFLEHAGDIGFYDNPAPPDIWMYFRVANTRKKTAPGPDALPYVAWKHRHAAPALLESDQELRSGKPAPNGFNDSTCEFLPKGEIARMMGKP